MKTLVSIVTILALTGLSACSNPADNELKAKAQAETLKESLDKANAVQQQIMDAEARRRESGEKAE